MPQSSKCSRYFKNIDFTLKIISKFHISFRFGFRNSDLNLHITVKSLGGFGRNAQVDVFIYLCDTFSIIEN